MPAATTTTTPTALPLMPVLTHLDHNRAIVLLKYHRRWFSDSAPLDLITTQLHWMLMLLLCLDPPLFPDHSSILRDLVRRLQSCRNTWIDQGVFDGIQSVHQVNSDPRLVGVWIIVVAVSSIFGQADFSDEPRPENEEKPNDNDDDDDDDDEDVQMGIENAMDEDQDEDGAVQVDTHYEEDEELVLGDERYF
ncbi:hypothetical protein BDR26DRAFT_850514 [Obelidium mucronatum]|nr:hypothetical protein BDR26DRAFT_850514 [Obelidium mucronatum]